MADTLAEVRAEAVQFVAHIDAGVWALALEAYQIGRDERTAGIAAWLRREATGLPPEHGAVLMAAADRLERITTDSGRPGVSNG